MNAELIPLQQAVVIRGQRVWGKIKATAAEQRQLWREVGEALSYGRALHLSNPKFGADAWRGPGWDSLRPFEGNRLRPMGQKHRRDHTVSEPGLYCLVLRSDKHGVGTFHKRVTSVALPAIRCDGAYVKTQVQLGSELIRHRVTGESPARHSLSWVRK